MHFNYIRKYLSNEDLSELKDEITSIEKVSSVELRLCLKKKKGLHLKKMNPRELAIKEFHKLGMHNTSGKTGLLIFILFDEKQFEIIADEGVNSKIPDTVWETIKGHIKNEFSAGNYKEGLVKCLNEMKTVLEKELPPDGSDKNQLPDDIVIE
ncbi:hypothetical protein D4R20_02120 [bacterium]|nr:MAG: hypothetical protein D4R20_02120 [bacterium]